MASRYGSSGTSRAGPVSSRRLGIVRYGTYVPYRRLDRTEIAPVAGRGGGKGTRSVASYDEDTTTMAVESARPLLSALSQASLAEHGQNAVDTLWFATTTPAYADKTNATAIHAALRLDHATPAFDANGSVRSAMGALRAGLAGGGSALVIAADMRTGLPGSPDEAAGGDAAAALLVGEQRDDTPLVAELLGWASATEEFLDRWRAPGDLSSKVWEERFGEGRYVAAGERAVTDALKAAGLVADEIDHLLIVGSHGRACTQLRRRLRASASATRTNHVGSGDRARQPDRQGAADAGGSSAAAGRRSELSGEELEAGLHGKIGFTGAAHPGLALAVALDEAEPEEVVALVVLADGADVLLLRTTEALAARRQPRPLASQIAGGGPIAYGTYLAWRGLLPIEPPRRPEPARPSAPAAHRSLDWKFGFVGSQDDAGTVHLPPSPRDTTARPMAGATGTIATFTIDRMAYSPSPPVVFAVVDFDGGGRVPVELTDVDVDGVRIGGRVELTFRKLFTADGVHNYFWKARPLQEGS